MQESGFTALEKDHVFDKTIDATVKVYFSKTCRPKADKRCRSNRSSAEAVPHQAMPADMIKNADGSQERITLLCFLSLDLATFFDFTPPINRRTDRISPCVYVV